MEQEHGEKSLSCRCATWVSALIRLSLGWTFLWAFLDKLFGWGFATTAEKAWINGGSPTLGFLKFGTTGPFAEIFQAMAGNIVVDWLFMLGLLGIGVALLLGVAVRLAGWSGALLMLLMWLAVLPKENNPFMDDHIIYGLMLIWMAYKPTVGNKLGFGKQWSALGLVERFPFLR